MIKSIVREFLIVEKFINLVDIFPDFCDVKGPEILEKSFIDKVLNGKILTLSILKKKALEMSLGGLWSAR